VQFHERAPRLQALHRPCLQTKCRFRVAELRAPVDRCGHGVGHVNSAFGTRAKLKEGQGQFGFAPVVQTSTCSAMARASSTSMPRYLTVLSTLVCPNSSCTARKLPVGTIDECRFGTPKGVCTEKVRVEPDPCNPARDKPGILPGGHAAVVITAATEKKLARFLTSCLDVIVDGLSRLLCQLKPDGPTGLLLPHCRAIDRIAARCNVLDPKCDDIAAPQLAVDRQIEHCQVARPSVHLQSGTDRPNMFWPQWWLLADELALVPGLSPRR
jgi:hypothetical protein